MAKKGSVSTNWDLITIWIFFSKYNHRAHCLDGTSVRQKKMQMWRTYWAGRAYQRDNNECGKRSDVEKEKTNRIRILKLIQSIQIKLCWQKEVSHFCLKHLHKITIVPRRQQKLHNGLFLFIVQVFPKTSPDFFCIEN